MRKSEWARKDYDIARAFIEDNEELAAQTPILSCGQGVTAILPLEVPGLGFRLHGLIMLAPIPILMICAILVPVFGFSGNWQFTLTTASITLGCAIMVLGLLRVIRLVVGQRETFPRQYFATLGPKGVSMNFSRFQLPFCSPQQELTWKEVNKFDSTREFFLPGVLIFKPLLSGLRVQSKEGSSVIVPSPSGANQLDDLKKLLEISRSQSSLK